MRNMKTVNLKIQLEVTDNETKVDWIQKAIQDCLVIEEGEKINIFSVIPEPLRFTMELHPTEHDESDDIEDVKTITAYGNFD